MGDEEGLAELALTSARSGAGQCRETLGCSGAESTSCHSSWSLEGQSWFEGVAAWQRQDQSYGGGA